MAELQAINYYDQQDQEKAQLESQVLMSEKDYLKIRQSLFNRQNTGDNNEQFLQKFRKAARDRLAKRTGTN